VSVCLSVCLFVRLQLRKDCKDHLQICRAAPGRPMNGFRCQKILGFWVEGRKIWDCSSMHYRHSFHFHITFISTTISTLPAHNAVYRTSKVQGARQDRPVANAAQGYRLRLPSNIHISPTGAAINEKCRFSAPYSRTPTFVCQNHFWGVLKLHWKFGGDWLNSFQVISEQTYRQTHKQNYCIRCVYCQIWCKLWVSNIKHHKNDKAGSIHFELMADWALHCGDTHNTTRLITLCFRPL